MTLHSRLIQRARRLAKIALGRDLYAPIQYRCPTERHGDAYGGWVICPAGLGPQTLVYACGVGTDISFDLSLIAAYGLTLHAFDPTPKSIAWLQRQALPAQFHFHPYGIAAEDGTVSFFPPANPDHVSHTMVAGAGQDPGRAVAVPVRRLSSLASELGHTAIDILKLDIEGAEYQALPDILASGLTIRQILVEFHHRFGQFRPADTRRAIDLLNRSGYQIFAVSPSGEEYSFIRV